VPKSERERERERERVSEKGWGREKETVCPGQDVLSDRGEVVVRWW
jgi:hypothetical protein